MFLIISIAAPERKNGPFFFSEHKKSIEMSETSPPTNERTQLQSVAEEAQISNSAAAVVVLKEQSNVTVTSEILDSPTQKHSMNDPDFVKVPLTRLQFILVFLSLGLGIFIVSIDFTIVSTAIPAIAKEFNNLDQIAWIGSAFFLTATAFSPTYGSLCDIFGRKEVFISSVTIFEIGSLMCGVAPSLIVLIFGRAVQGIGLGGIISCTFILISDIVALRDRGTYQGIIGAVYGMAGIVGPLLGGVLTDGISWRWCFYINLPVGFITLVVILICLKFPAPEGTIMEKIHKVDYLGTFWIVVASSLLIVPLTNGGTVWSWSDPKTIGLICASIVSGLIFVFVEVKVASHPLIPKSLFMNRSVFLLLAISWILASCYFSICFYAPSFYQYVYGDTATMSGVKTIPLVFGAVALMIASGVSYSMTGKYKRFLFVGSIFLTAGEILLSTMMPNTNKVAELFYLLIAGIGAG